MIKDSTSLSNSALSPTLKINQRCVEMVAAGKEVYRFGFGESPFPIPEQIVEVLKKNAFQKSYLNTSGLKELRENVASQFSKSTSINYTAENVVIGPGSKELIFLIQLVSKCTLLLPSPSWVSYAPQAEMLGNKVVWLNTTAENNYILEPKNLETYCLNNPGSNKLLILNYPNNPTGLTYTPEYLKRLAEVARKYDVLILSDEIYGKVNHENNHRSIADFYPEGTMITEGLSKWCGAGGWRLGIIIIPDTLKDIRNKLIEAASETFSCVNAPTQYAAAAAYKDSEKTELFLQNSRTILKTIGQYVANQLNQANIETPVPEGGFYLFPNFSFYAKKLNKKDIYTSEELCQKLLNATGVALLPGSAFGRSARELTVRLAYVDFDGNQALNWCRENKIEDNSTYFINNYFPKIVKGTQLIISWINKC